MEVSLQDLDRSSMVMGMHRMSVRSRAVFFMLSLPSSGTSVVLSAQTRSVERQTPRYASEIFDFLCPPRNLHSAHR